MTNGIKLTFGGLLANVKPLSKFGGNRKNRTNSTSHLLSISWGYRFVRPVCNGQFVELCNYLIPGVVGGTSLVTILLLSALFCKSSAPGCFSNIACIHGGRGLLLQLCGSILQIVFACFHESLEYFLYIICENSKQRTLLKNVSA